MSLNKSSFNKDIRVVSLVPSWTEVLIECGVNVIGRTTQCSSPANIIENIPEVGSVREINWEKIQSLEPDFIILDCFENQIEPNNYSTSQYIITKIKSIDDISKTLLDLSHKLNNQKLFNLAGRWQSIESAEAIFLGDINFFPDLIQWIRKPTTKIQKILFLIWKDPWISISKNSYPYSILKKFNLEKYIPQYNYNDPEIDLYDFDTNSTLLVYLDSPYPFQEKIQELSKTPFPSIIVNGQHYSWFGIKSLVFLETQLERFKPKQKQFKIRC